jgi:1,4-dihydroxy-6-naphthoate synthase
MAEQEGKLLRIGHSPDPDDAFMWYPLADLGDGPKVDTRGYRFEHVLEDIESLNHRAERGELEITALSIHQYGHVADRYILTSCGSSMGDNYGPMVVSRQALSTDQLPRLNIAVPGERTTAFLALSLLMQSLGEFNVSHYQVVPFDQIISRVASGEFDAGLIIHEGQLTYADRGLERVVDLGQWWTMTRGLPLPLGGNAIRRDLADEAPAICTVLLDSIRYALEHRDEAIDYAMNYARDMGKDLADRFVGMYVNEYTLDYGEVGRRAVTQLLKEAEAAGLVPGQGNVEIVEPG